jgi:hypothetical protein
MADGGSLGPRGGSLGVGGLDFIILGQCAMACIYELIQVVVILFTLARFSSRVGLLINRAKVLTQLV